MQQTNTLVAVLAFLAQGAVGIVANSQALGVRNLPQGKNGLPLHEGPRPKWLARQDELVIDARPQQHSGMLIMQLVLMDAGGYWGKMNKDRPRWLRAILATNRHHARKHGHAMVIRWRPTLQLTGWQQHQCEHGKNSVKDREECIKRWERENFCWEKFPFFVDYLLSEQRFTHMVLLDADAALVRHNVNILGGIATQMQEQNVDVFLTNEDWLKNGKERINGGVIMARNTKWAEDMFQDTWDAHRLGPETPKEWRIGKTGVLCMSNEQICLNDLFYGPGRKLIQGHMAFESGIVYNRGGCTLRHCFEPISDKSMEDLRLNDDRLQIVHFMGGSKGFAPEVLCDEGQNFTGEDEEGYGCRK